MTPHQNVKPEPKIECSLSWNHTFYFPSEFSSVLLKTKAAITLKTIAFVSIVELTIINLDITLLNAFHNSLQVISDLWV